MLTPRLRDKVQLAKEELERIVMERKVAEKARVEVCVFLSILLRSLIF